MRIKNLCQLLQELKWHLSSYKTAKCFSTLDVMPENCQSLPNLRQISPVKLNYLETRKRSAGIPVF